MPDKKVGGDFHVVRKRQFTRTKAGRSILRMKSCEIYCNNVPFLRGSGKPLSLREAKWLRDILNERFARCCKHRDPTKAVA